MKSRLKASAILGGILLFAIASQAGLIIGREDAVSLPTEHFMSILHMIF